MNRERKTMPAVVAALLLCAVPSLFSQAQQGQQSQEQPKLEDVRPQTNPELEAVQQILQTNDPKTRVTLTESFLSQYPESAYRRNVFVAVSGAYRILENFEKAIEFGEKALELDPRDPVTLLIVSDSLSEGSKPEMENYEMRLSRAEDYSRRSLTLLPEVFAALPRRPEVPEEQYRLQEQYLEAQAHATLGYIHYRRKNFADAEQELRMAIELNQYSPNPADFERLGVVQAELNKVEDARAALQRCVEIGDAQFKSTCGRRLEMLGPAMQQQAKPEE